jgi:hypothetical protein
MILYAYSVRIVIILRLVYLCCLEVLYFDEYFAEKATVI